MRYTWLIENSQHLTGIDKPIDLPAPYIVTTCSVQGCIIQHAVIGTVTVITILPFPL